MIKSGIAPLTMSYNVCTNDTGCSMSTKEEGQMNMVATLRLIMASLSLLGAMSIVVSAIKRKTVCNPRVHPIFVIAIADSLLSVLWISGSILWLKRGATPHVTSSGGCFTLNLLTVILQCAAMNVTLIYALLAYSSIKQKSCSGGLYYMVQQRQASLHVWPPLCSFISYLLAWVIPTVLVSVVFAVFSLQYRLLQKADNCACWCVLFYGNVLPRQQFGTASNQEAQVQYKLLLHKFITSYSVLLGVNSLVVFCCLGAVYCIVLLHIKRMRHIQESTPLIHQATIVSGQRDAKIRISLFLTIFLLSGIITFSFGVSGIATQVKQSTSHHHVHHHTSSTIEKYFIFLLLEALFVPIQGFLNALVYGWTRGEFASVMQQQCGRTQPQPCNDSLSFSTEADEDSVENEEKEIFLSVQKSGKGLREDGSLSPVSLDDIQGGHLHRNSQH